MTKPQKVILIITVALVVLSFVFPHWTNESGGHWASFYPIFSPPNYAPVLDFQKTCIQAIAILILGVVTFLFIGNRRKRQSTAVLFGISLILLSYLFPCWEFKRDGDILQSKQFHVILTPPHYNRQQMSVNYKQLQYQIAVILIITIGLAYITRND